MYPATTVKGSKLKYLDRENNHILEIIDVGGNSFRTRGQCAVLYEGRLQEEGKFEQKIYPFLGQMRENALFRVKELDFQGMSKY